MVWINYYEVHISAQTQHARKSFSDWIQHLHIVKTVDAPGYPRYGIEFILIGLTKDIGGTSMLYSNPVKLYDDTTNTNLFMQHTLAEFKDAIDGSAAGISSSFNARLFRDIDWEIANDGVVVDDGEGGTYTYVRYPYDIILFASDGHIIKDDDGSEEPYIKEV